jgi:hypothetical protein
MKSLILLPAILLISIQAFPQDCSKEILAQKTGTWKAGQQGSIQNVTASDLTKEKSVLANIHKMISSEYLPIGCEVSYSTVYGKNPMEGQVFKADPYYYAMYILRYLCDNNTPDKSDYYVDVSTTTTVNIVANAIYSLNTLYAANIPDDDFRGYLKLEKRPEKKDGYYFLGEKVVGDSHLENKIMEYRWLITYNDTLPFTYLSRKEYLLIQQKRLEPEHVRQQEDLPSAFLKMPACISPAEPARDASAGGERNRDASEQQEQRRRPARCKQNQRERERVAPALQGPRID